jgi:AMP-polyphosphate phosphotransferase
MLEKVDLDKKLKRKEWKELRPELQRRLYDLKKAAYDAGMPAIVLFEGWDAAGKGTSIRLLTERLDPRGFKVWPIRAARTFERNHPWLWRFWLKLPARGEMAIFDRSWYGRVLVERVEGLTSPAEWNDAYRDIVDFEHMLADDGHVLVKFWLHISKAEQARRFKLLEKDPLRSWQVQSEDWEHHWRYKDYLKATEEMLERTETAWGPWTIVEATDQCYTWHKVLTTVCDALAENLRSRGIDPDALSEEAVTDAAATQDATVTDPAGPSASPTAETVTQMPGGGISVADDEAGEPEPMPPQPDPTGETGTA